MTQPIAPLPYWDYFLPMIFVAGAAIRSRSKRKGAKSTRIKPGVQYKQDPETGKWIPTDFNIQRSDVQPSNAKISQPTNLQFSDLPNTGFSLRWPLDPGFVVTQDFQQHLQTKLEKGYKYYNGGLDLAFFDVREGAPVCAAFHGVLKSASYSASGYGNVVYIDHLNGYLTIYAHLQGFAGIAPGSLVNAGDVIGYLGHTGNCNGGPGNPNGVHLHFEVRYLGAPIDPMPYLS
jgi:murein DD-endopeptidase MepM/ murein hydrolase activator NlpD